MPPTFGNLDCTATPRSRSEEHTSELQSQSNLVCRLLLEKKKKKACRQVVTTYQTIWKSRDARTSGQVDTISLLGLEETCAEWYRCTLVSATASLCADTSTLCARLRRCLLCLPSSTGCVPCSGRSVPHPLHPGLLCTPTHSVLFYLPPYSCPHLFLFFFF